MAETLLNHAVATCTTCNKSSDFYKSQDKLIKTLEKNVQIIFFFLKISPFTRFREDKLVKLWKRPKIFIVHKGNLVKA